MAMVPKAQKPIFPQASVCVFVVHGRQVCLTPLVTTFNKSTNETSNDHDFVKENGPENGRPGQASSKEEIHQK
jgi:hypothetical protein